MFTTKAILLVTLFKLVKAHGLMVWPSPRLEPGDAGNGYWIARSATKDACHGLSAGPVLTPALTGGSASIDYVVTVAHKGGCKVYLDRGNGWEQIGEDPTCGVSAHTGSIGITLPPGDYNAVIRWYWATDNASGEEFQTCADIKVSSQGTNLHSPPEQFGTNTCTQTGDMICYGNGYNECGAIDPATNKGYWVQKPCPGGHICNQIGLSDPLHKVLGLVECGYGSGAVQAQIPVPSVASSTNSPVIQPVTTSAIVSPTQISVPATASYESIITRVIASNTFSPQNQGSSISPDVLAKVAAVIESAPTCAQACVSRLHSTTTADDLTSICNNLDLFIPLIVGCVNTQCSPLVDSNFQTDLQLVVGLLPQVPQQCSVLLSKKMVYEFSFATDAQNKIVGVVATDVNNKTIAVPSAFGELSSGLNATTIFVTATLQPSVSTIPLITALTKAPSATVLNIRVGKAESRMGLSLFLSLVLLLLSI